MTKKSKKSKSKKSKSVGKKSTGNKVLARLQKLKTKAIMKNGS
jgi:hypothetical protein